MKASSNFYITTINFVSPYPASHNLYLAVRPHCQHKQHEPWEAQQALSKYLIARHNLCRVLYHYVPPRQTLTIFKNLFFCRLCKLFATQNYPLIKYKEHSNTVTKSLASVQASQEQPLINIFILTFNRSDVQRYFSAFSGTLAYKANTSRSLRPCNVFASHKVTAPSRKIHVHRPWVTSVIKSSQKFTCHSNAHYQLFQFHYFGF